MLIMTRKLSLLAICPGLSFMTAPSSFAADALDLPQSQAKRVIEVPSHAASARNATRLSNECVCRDLAVGEACTANRCEYLRPHVVVYGGMWGSSYHQHHGMQHFHLSYRDEDAVYDAHHLAHDNHTHHTYDHHHHKKHRYGHGYAAPVGHGT